MGVKLWHAVTSAVVVQVGSFMENHGPRDMFLGSLFSVKGILFRETWNTNCKYADHCRSISFRIGDYGSVYWRSVTGHRLIGAMAIVFLVGTWFNGCWLSRLAILALHPCSWSTTCLLLSCVWTSDVPSWMKSGTLPWSCRIKTLCCD